MWFPNRSDTNRAMQAQKMARRLKFRIYMYEEEELYYPCCENKGADQLGSYCEADQRLTFSGLIVWNVFSQLHKMSPSLDIFVKSCIK